MEKENRTGSEIAPSRAAVSDVQSVEASIRACIFTIRGVQVMLDRDLAELYGVETKRINEAVKRNLDRFPEQLMFQLTKDEQNFIDYSLRSKFSTLDNLKSQIATSSWGGKRKLPYAFTEQGVAMISSVQLMIKTVMGAV